jgi:exosome complex RNA-binding protein Csl4
MADYGNMGPMMTDETAASAPAEAPAEVPAEPAESAPTAELPKSVLGGQTFKPGDEVTLRVMEVTENSVLVSFAGAEETAPPEAAPAAAPPPGGGMGAMME